MDSADSLVSLGPPNTGGILYFVIFLIDLFLVFMSDVFPDITLHSLGLAIGA